MTAFRIEARALPPMRARGKNPAMPDHAESGQAYQRGDFFDQLERLESDVGGSVAPAAFQAIRRAALSKVHFGPNMYEYKIEMSLFLVNAFFLHGAINKGNVHLNPQASHHEGPKTVTDVLNQKRQFIPIILKLEQIRFINNTHIIMMSFPLCIESIGHWMPCYAADVEINLDYRTQKKQIFVFQLPKHITRLKDFLNHADSFVELRMDREIYPL